jgi:hypothetical protein
MVISCYSLQRAQSSLSSLHYQGLELWLAEDH